MGKYAVVIHNQAIDATQVYDCASYEEASAVLSAAFNKALESEKKEPGYIGSKIEKDSAEINFDYGDGFSQKFEIVPVLDPQAILTENKDIKKKTDKKLYQLIGKDMTLNEGMTFATFFRSEEEAKQYIANLPEDTRDDFDCMEVPGNTEVTVNIKGSQINDFNLIAHVTADDLSRCYDLDDEEGKDEFFTMLLEKGYEPMLEECPEFTIDSIDISGVSHENEQSLQDYDDDEYER